MSNHLIEGLLNPALYPHAVEEFSVIETHISWVILTGQYAYKIKKPVDFGFLDFSTLEKRKHYCEEEVRLNRELAPHIYMGVIDIHGTPEKPVLSSDGPVIEYAVQMRQFDQAAQMDRMLANDRLDSTHIDKIANTVATFHTSITPVSPDSPFGDYEHVSEPVMENFSQIRAHLNDSTALGYVDSLQQWSENRLKALKPVISSRKQQGYIRPCHGDMHLRNMALVDDEIVIFDRIEFNTNFYLIDVMSEIAFLMMDLEYRQQHQFSNRFLNLYLEHTGDYQGLQVLDFYKVYRAMVRSKVDALRLSQEQPGSSDYQHTWHSLTNHLQLAQSYTHEVTPVILINAGVSGSGKSFIGRRLAEKLPAVVIRSDVERKRLFGLQTRQRTGDQLDQGIYTSEATEQTYDQLRKLSRLILSCHRNVIVDAANLKHQQRQQFIDIASELSVSCRILWYHAKPEVLRQRVLSRQQQNRDASDAGADILEHQLTTYEPMAGDETDITISIDSENDVEIDDLVTRITTSLKAQG